MNYGPSGFFTLPPSSLKEFLNLVLVFAMIFCPPPKISRYFVVFTGTMPHDSHGNPRAIGGVMKPGKTIDDDPAVYVASIISKE